MEVTYTVKLVKYDEKQKIALIKEMKNIMEGMNLVQVIKIILFWNLLFQHARVFTASISPVFFPHFSPL